MGEGRAPRLAPRQLLWRRLRRTSLLAGGIIGGSLAIGVAGYHFLAGLPWIDSLLNASMILGGMGPVDTLTSNQGKLFASVYALYSGVVLLGSVAVFLAPLVHRLLHRYHFDLDE